MSPRFPWGVAGLALAVVGCAGSVPPPPCSQIPGCPQIGCCDATRNCREEVCQGVGWVCRGVPEGGYRWLGDGSRCLPDAGPLPDLAVIDGGGGCSPGSCGANAECMLGACACKKGYANSDLRWENGCEELDARCKSSACGFCPDPDGYCGPNAHCRDLQKCRCSDPAWKETRDANGIFLGCLTPTSNCRADNCNNCYTGYCGPHADCRKNVCKCIESGFVDCNGKWEYDGCECAGSCSGGACQ